MNISNKETPFTNIRQALEGVFHLCPSESPVDTVQYPSGISPRIYSRLRTLLLRCGPCESDNSLRTIFVDSRVALWFGDLPCETTPKKRINELIKYLHEKFNSVHENALVLFLRVLRDQIHPEDACYQELANLADELESEIKNPVTEADLTQLRTEYLAYLCERYQYLDIRGLPQVQQMTQQLPLQEIYIPLRAYPVSDAHAVYRIAGRERAQEEATKPTTAISVNQDSENYVVSESRDTIEKILASHPSIVVLGDPGAGKSTLLKVLSLVWAEQSENGPLPIIVPLHAYADRLSKQGQISLADYLAEYFAFRSPKFSRIADLFYQALNNQQAIVLLDGLDEVRADRAYLVELIQDFVKEFTLSPDEEKAVSGGAAVPALGNRVVVTSRIVGYEDAPLPAHPWRAYVLTDFESDDIEQFVEKWTLVIAQAIKGGTDNAQEEAETERRELLGTIFARSGVRKLAANPLLLTVLALVKYSGVALPDERVKLYELYLETLIESWNRARALDRRSVGPDVNYEDTVQILAPMALWLRKQNAPAGLIHRDDLEEWLVQHYRSDEWGYTKGEARRQGRKFLQEIQASSFLVERGENRYGFLHLTLEEMLAAQGIAYLMDEDFATGFDIFREHLLDAHWRETLLLAVGFIGVIRRNRTLSGEILQKILQLDMPSEFAHRQIVFAGEALLDMGKTKIRHPIAEEIIHALVKAMETSASHVLTRRDAGVVLGRLGDPRKGVLTLPPLLTDPIQGKFKLCHSEQMETITPFKAGVHPVTNAQFAAFIENGGYNKEVWWSEPGWLWRHRMFQTGGQKPAQPKHWDDALFNNPNHPVVGVTWYEAEAFCRWLSDRYGANYRLPTESEWECMAGGPEGYLYPWGNAWTENAANTLESGMGQPGAVGIFLESVSPTGAYDCAGNVWEWCDDWYDARQRRKVLRGGAWNYDKTAARCGERSGDLPQGSLNNVGFRVIMEST